MEQETRHLKPREKESDVLIMEEQNRRLQKMNNEQVQEIKALINNKNDMMNEILRLKDELGNLKSLL